MTRIKVLLLLLMMGAMVLAAQAQPKKVTGVVRAASDGNVLPGVNITVKGSQTSTLTDMYGHYEITVPGEQSVLVFSYIGFISLEVPVKGKSVINVKLKEDVRSLEEVVITRKALGKSKGYNSSAVISIPAVNEDVFYNNNHDRLAPHNTEEYSTIHDNIFRETTKNPLSTFSIDVDRASYTNVRRFISQGSQPPKDAVRIEEMINYFAYDYPEPQGDAPFAIHTELSACPWNRANQLLHIGLQGKNIAKDQLPPSNLVFLIDVSGSMNTPERLPLVKAGFRLLVNELRPQDRVAIVVYAGAAGLVLPSTSGKEKAVILEAIDQLEAGGSTAGGQGIKLAYQVALENFKKDGNNRVILATDGDFNVGVSSNAEMERLIEKKRESGVFLTVLGFGMGNYKDSKMEILANKGNGNYAYIDNLLEAKKVFVNEFGGTLFTIAKDVKLQIEFNPAKVKAYRLIGYENRVLQNEDFNNDKKDAGELGAGHTVTALYELIPAKSGNTDFVQLIDTLKYQSSKVSPQALNTNELMTLKLRYKKPEGDTSKLLVKTVLNNPVSPDKTSDNFRFAAAVASFGMLLRDSEFKGKSSYSEVLKLAKGAQGKDEEGYRAEFIQMVRSMLLIAER